MAQSSLLAPGEFGGKRQKRIDPTGDIKANQIRFSSNPSESKTMRISGGHLPKAPEKHPHHRKAGQRSKRIR